LKPSDDTATPSMVVPEKAGASCREPAGAALVIGPLVPAVMPADDPHPATKTKADTATNPTKPHRAAFENCLIHAPPTGGFVTLYQVLSYTPGGI
jgi:hypothetical protein